MSQSKQILFFDTETTGVPQSRDAPVSQPSQWPHIVQLAWKLSDDEGHEIHSASHVIAPDGYEIPQDAAEVHGITTERATKEGQSAPRIVSEFEKTAARATHVVAHNYDFDAKILGAECARQERSNPIIEIPGLCLMKTAAPFCGMLGRHGFKWPTLEELHETVFGKGFENAHDALADVNATARCFFELRTLGIVGLDEEEQK